MISLTILLLSVGLGDIYPAMPSAQTTQQAMVAARMEQTAFTWLLIFGMGSLASFIAAVQALVHGLAAAQTLDEQFASRMEKETGMF